MSERSRKPARPPSRLYRHGFVGEEEWDSKVRMDKAHPGEAWVELASPDGWFVEQHIVEQSGRIVVAELRVHHDPDKPLPTGGLTARRLRSIKVQGHLSTLRDVLSSQFEVADARGSQPKVEGFSRASLRDARPGRAGLSDRHYAEVANAYVHLVASGSTRPVAALADRHHVSASRMASQLHKARTKGILSSSPAGLPGGELTPMGRALLQDEAEAQPAQAQRSKTKQARKPK